jgi:hypothetical protein
MATAPMLDPQDEPVGGGAMSDDELASHLAEHETRAIGYYEGEIASEQADALDRYYRRPYGDERDGRSQAVDATVAITVDNALAAILKPFVSSDETVVFQPRQPEDEDQAEQATEYVNFVLHSDNCGFSILHDWFKDALLQKVGVVKAYWEDYSRPQAVRLENLDAVQLQQLLQTEKVIDGPFGPDEFGLYVLDIERIDRDGKICIENVPPEEYRISPQARPGRVPPYEAHITRKSRSELVEMGFDHESVMGLSKSSNSGIDDSRSQARYEDEDLGSQRLDQPGGAMNELVDFNDEFVQIDFDGDGITELRRVMRSGNVILYNEEVEFALFARLCPAPMPHKIYGLSLADQVKDEQRVSTAILRQTLDNVYLSNNPRPVVPQSAERADGSTISDLLDEAPGALIRTKDGTVESFAVPFVAGESFPMLSYVEQRATARTGISAMGQGMDPDALDTAGQMTATQAAIMEDGRNSRAEMIARIFAETGVKDLFRLILKLLVQHQPRSRVIRLRNKWVEMDPRTWNSDMDLSISVGMGVGNKAEQMASAQMVLQTMEALGGTPYASLIDSEKVFNALKRLFNAAGIKSVTDYLNEPKRDEQGNLQEPPQPPDPKMMELQAKLQLQQQQLQAKAAADQAAAQQQAQQVFFNMQLEQSKAAAKAQLDQATASFQAELAQQKFHFEATMAMLEQRMNEQLAQRDADRADTIAQTKISQNRDGGDLSK